MTGLVGRCLRCHVKIAHCVCAAIPVVESAIEIVVIRHAREGWRSTGTARIAGLALPKLRFVDYGDAALPARAELPALLLPGACALYPSPEPTPAPPQLKQLVVLDGTWRETRRMWHRLEILHPLPKLSLPQQARSMIRLREPTFEGGRSTLEAIADALALLEGPAVAEPLHALHALYVERVLRARGEWGRKQQQRRDQGGPEGG